jgi:GAF domain-containing protein
MTDQQALIRAFADYARTISGRYDISDVLYRLTDQVQEVLDIDGAGVSLGNADGGLRFVTATDERISHVEERQVTAGQGPCHDAFVSGDRVTSADLAAEKRWPAYTSEALSHDCRAVAGIPMLAGGQRLGALNLYVRRPREWPADELDIAQVLADMATGYIINARTLSETEQVSAQLQHALDSRIVIEQAKGILAERHRIDPATAFDRLRRYSRSHNRKVHDVARAIVEGTLRL